jgi:N4-gp56 family major capsid protein
MALQTTVSAGLSAEMKTFYDRQLLTRTVPMLLHAKFGQKKRIPAHGGRIIEFRKFSGLAVATTPLTEGALFTNLKDLTVTATTATVAQYGDAVGFSDLVSTTTIDPLLQETTEILAEQAAETIDELVRDTLVGGTTVLYVGTDTARNTIAATDIITVADVARIALQMRINRAKQIDGAWQAITHPRVIFDLIRTSEWREAQNYHQTGRPFDGSVGQLYGLRFWETDKAKVYEDASNGAGAGGTVDVYTMLVFGREAFGIVDLAGHNLKTVFKPLGSAGTADPLDQQSSMGWKVTFGVKRLQEAFMLRYECATSTGANT